jgi:hypothetical protein
LAYDARQFDPREFEKSGGLYVFTRRDAVVSGGTGQPGTGATVEEQFWQQTQTMRLSPPSLAARDGFGATAVALDGETVVVGAHGDDGLGRNAGAVYTLDVGLQRCYFESAEFVGLEGHDARVVVSVARDPSGEKLDRALTVAYATSDLTAKGVDSKKYAECLDRPVSAREGCGDYLMTAGEVTFAPGDATVDFTVFLVNDACYEHHPEYFLVTLSIPGAGAAQGEDYIARVRIDDDDLGSAECAHAFL